jgi:hypothetical protein
MEYVPYVGFVTNSRATVMTHFVCLYKKNKKKGSSHFVFCIFVLVPTC